MGRASTFTQEIADCICDRIADGLSLRTICEDDDMPHASQVDRWLAHEDNAAFREQYARARERQADALADKMLDVAAKATSETAAADRIKIDVYKWRAGKLKPKVYGDKLELGGDMSVTVNVVRLA